MSCQPGPGHAKALGLTFNVCMAWLHNTVLHSGHRDPGDQRVTLLSILNTDTKKDAIPEIIVHTEEAVKDRQCLAHRNKFGSERESGEFKWGPGRPGQCRALVKHSPMPQSLSSELASITTSSQPAPLPFIQQQTTALVTTAARCSIMIHGWMTLGSGRIRMRSRLIPSSRL